MTRLEPGGAAERLAVGGLRGATFSRNCARIHPFRLARGLARAVEARAVRIHEGTRVADVHTGRLLTKEGTAVRARHILRAAEAWTSRLPGHRRTVTPVYSLVVATAPLPQSLWDQIGLADAEAFSQHPHVIVYGQRSTDDQIVFGGRGAPYHFGSGIRAGFDADPKVFETLRRSLTSSSRRQRGSSSPTPGRASGHRPGLAPRCRT